MTPSANAPESPTAVGPRRLATLSALLVLTGCGGGAPGPGGEVQIHDSAGVVIVVHPPELRAPPAWHVALDDALRLSGDFFQVRGAVRLADGRLVVADGGSRTLRFFGAHGTATSSVGRDGDGPGEFSHLTWMGGWPGDSILVFDRQLRRATLFDALGTLGRVFALETTDAVPFAMVHGVHRDGSLLATGFTQTPATGPEPGLHRYPTPAIAFAPDGSLRGALPLATSSEAYFETFDGGGFSVFPALFPRTTGLVAGPDVLVEAPNDTFELRLYSPEGELLRIIRTSGPASPRLTPELRQLMIERRIEESASGRDPAELRRVYEGMDTPERVPAYGPVAVDRAGYVWVERPDPTGEADSDWLVFDPDGLLASALRLPRGFGLLDVGADYVLGVRTDDLGVEEVVLAPLEGRAKLSPRRP